MFKPGVIHYNFPDFTFDQFLRFAAETGYQFVELRLPDVWDETSDHDPLQNATRVRKQAESFGLRVSALAAHNDFVQIDEGLISSQVARMRRVCELAHILDEEAVVRTEGGMMKDIPEEKWGDAIYACLARCLDFVDEIGVGLAVDNHGMVTNKEGLLIDVLGRIDHPLIGANLDTMNYRWFGHSLEECDRFYQAIAPHVLHVHLKDGFGACDNYVGAVLGDGEIHLQHALYSLKSAGYNGVYCAEYEGADLQDGVGYAKCFQWLRENVRN